MFHIVLVEPEIPQNTGNIVRTCAVTGAYLHLVKPLGFSLEDKYLKRAGLDYWHAAKVCVYENFDEVLEKFAGARFFYFTTHAKKSYAQIAYADGDLLVFGSETKGLDKKILDAAPEGLVRIPMLEDIRCLNLSNSVAIGLYEAIRQTGFSGLR